MTALQAQQSTEPTQATNPESGSESKTVEVVETKKPPVAPVLSKTEVREEMLERLGDQMSLRMRSLSEREKSLSQREQSLIEREKRAVEREQLIQQIEKGLLDREEVVRRREKLPPPQSWRGNDAPSIYGKYAVVLDGKTMQFYHTKDALEPTPVASTQKLLTALIICAEEELDEYMEIPREATLVEPTKIGVRTGDKYTRRQLLSSLLIRSGNDIAAALAIDNAGSREAFAEKMNRYADQIGLVNSNFKTPSGLPAVGQYSCARDVAVIAFEAYQHPEIRKIVNTKYYDFKFYNSDKVYQLRNTNRVVREWEHCNGLKTGYTHKAGKCLVCSAEIDGEHRISVIIKCSSQNVYNDSRKLLEWALDLEKLGPMNQNQGI